MELYHFEKMKKIYKGTATKCVYCDGSVPSTTRDHFYPKSKGGKVIVYACEECNRLKADLFPEEWIEKIKLLRHISDGKRANMITNTETLMYYLEDRCPRRKAPKTKVEEVAPEIDLRPKLVANNISRLDLSDSYNSNRKSINCECGVSKVTTQVNEYDMIRYWKDGDYLGSTNKLACQNCL